MEDNVIDSNHENNPNNNFIKSISQHKKKYEKLDVPKSKIWGEYTYVFKEQFKSDSNKFSYRCQKYNCHIPITITRDDLNKIKDTNNKEDIKCMIKKARVCKKNNLEKIEKADKCLSEKELTDKAKDIIKLNPLFSRIKQQKKLHDNNIYLEDKKVKTIINEVKNDIFEKDEPYVNNINMVTITIDEKLPNAQNIPFCPVFDKFLNPSKNNRLENLLY